MGSMNLSGGFHEPVCPWVHGTLARGFMEHRGWGSLGPLIPSRHQYSCPVAPSIVASAEWRKAFMRRQISMRDSGRA